MTRALKFLVWVKRWMISSHTLLYFFRSPIVQSFFEILEEILSVTRALRAPYVHKLQKKNMNIVS